jgi:Exoribonuclease R
LDDKKIIVKIDNWGISSLFPRGHFVSTIGKIGDEYTEGNVILLEHNVEIKNFSKHVMECLPPEGVHQKPLI